MPLVGLPQHIPPNHERSGVGRLSIQKSRPGGMADAQDVHGPICLIDSKEGDQWRQEDDANGTRTRLAYGERVALELSVNGIGG